MTTPTHKGAWIAGGVAGIALVVGGAAAAYCVHYQDLALPRTQVAGQSVGGMTRDQIATLVTQQAKAAVLTANVAGSSEQMDLNDVGVTVDAGKTADAVLAHNTTIGSRLKALLSPTTVDVVSSADRQVLPQLTSQLTKHAGELMVESTIQPDPQTGVFVAIPGKAGKSVDTQQLSEAISTLASTLQPASVPFTVLDVQPSVSAADAEKAAQAANQLIAPAVQVTDGIDTFTADGPTKAGWVTWSLKDGALTTPTVDQKNVEQWVNQTAKDSNVAPTPGINNVDASGAVLVESKPGVKGLEATNMKEVTAGIMKALDAGQDYAGDFDYRDVAPTSHTQPVMAGHEGFVYPMHEGEKWVDIDLTASTLTAYEGQDVIRSMDINHGGIGHETVTGTYHVYLKYSSQDMGCTPDWPYCVKDVPWVSYFTGSYAMHGAPWVEQFGIGTDASSHGCVNMKVPDAQWMYNWNEMGTAVVTHY